MGDVNWALGLPQTNPGQAFADAYQKGQETQRTNMSRQAMSALAMNPEDPKALQALAQYDPKTAMEFKQQQSQNALKQLDQHRESIKIGAQVISSVKPHDEATWRQARQIYAQAGGDLKDVPVNWTPETAQYVQHISQLAGVLSPEKQGQIVPYAPGGGVARLNPQTGQLENLVMPNDGSHAAGDPASGNPPRVTDAASYAAVPPGSQYTDPDGHVRMKPGGQTVAPSGGFLDPLGRSE